MRASLGSALAVTFSALVVALLLAIPASASVVGPYDGTNPFNCALQKAGTGTDFRDPDADPFCVEYDKTNQNVTDFGILDFLLNEPARVAAAVPKCFYYQKDHWTGSIEQGGSPTLWHWDGGYFFDKARGLGGVHVQNFEIGGQPADPRLLTGFPLDYSPYFGPGSGGVLVQLGAGDPSCIAKVDTPSEAARVYRRNPPPY